MKKVFNKIIILLFIFVSLLFGNINIKAATTINNPRILSIFPNTTNLTGVDYNRRSKKQDSNKIETSYQYAKFSGIGIYAINSIQVFCFEPGSGLVTNGTSDEKKDQKGYTKYDLTKQGELSAYAASSKNRYFTTLDENKLNKINAVFTFAKKPIVNLSLNSKIATYDTNFMYATQLLVWEIIDGERTSFASLKPDKNVSKDSAYCKMFGCSDLGTSKVSKLSTAEPTYGVSLTSAYKRLVQSVNSVFGSDASKTRSKIGSYSVGTSAKPAKHVMKYNSSSNQYEIIITDDYARYFRANSVGGVEISYPNNTTIKIVSKKPIKSQLLKFSVEGDFIKYNNGKIAKQVSPSNSTTNYPYAVYGDNAGYRQDLIAPTVKTYDVYMEVSTPNYALEIEKKDESGEPLEGAKFELYDTNKTKLGETLTTDSTGKASNSNITNNITKPGTYYVKEIKAADTYNLKEGIINGKIINSNNYQELQPIIVSESNTTGNPVKVTAVNKPNKIDLIKYTIDETTGEKIKSNTCDENEPVFKVLDDSNNVICFKKAPNTVRGSYTYAKCSESEVVNEIQTCNGEFTVTYMPGCEDGKTAKIYTIVELRAGGATIDKDRSKKINMCDTDRSISFYNGLTGLEFQKKDENGNLLPGGTFKLQKKENGVFLDKPVKEMGDGTYKYDETSTNFEIETSSGTAIISGLQTGNYRVVEIEPPEGYKKVDDSKAPEVIFGDNDSFKTIEMINGKESLRGDKANATLVLTISTGRKVIPYGLVIGALILGLIAFIIIRNKNKK